MANPGLTNCAGTAVIFTATTVNGGVSPSFVWKKNLSVVGSGSVYTNASPVNGDTIDCQLTSSATCVTTNIANATQLALVVNANVTPAVSVMANPGLTNCAGTTVIFSASPVNGGASPSYVWKTNSLVVAGATGGLYTNASPVNGDTIDCQLTSSATCVTTNIANATQLTLVVNVAPVGGTATAVPSTVCSNASAVVSLTGSTGTIQWQASLDNVTFTNVTGQTGANLTNSMAVTTYYRAVVTSGACGNATSTVATVTVTGGGQLGVSPASYNFGVVTNGTSKQFSFSVTNMGCGALSGTVTSSVPFTVVSGSPFNLSGYSATNVAVSFAPTNEGVYAANLIFASNGGTSTNSVTGQSAIVPVASFTASPTTVQVLQTVMFRDTSTGTITNRQWNFGDGTVTNTLNTIVVYQYQTNGVKTVTLTVSGPLGTNYISHPVTVTASLGIVATPVLTPNGGTFTNAVLVGISCSTTGATIRYTLDGSLPTNSSTVYTGLLTLTNSVTLKAAGFATGYLQSAIVSANFTINLPPVLTITTGSTLPLGLQGVAYNSVGFQATNGLPPYTWTASGLPSGMRFTSTGILSGTPSKAGTNSFWVTVKDASRPNLSAKQLFSLTVTNPVLTFTPLAGTYSGLIIQNADPTYESSGFIQIVLSKSGAFAGNLTLGGIKTAYKGQFDLTGIATNAVTNAAVITSVALNLDLTGSSGMITGVVIGADFTSDLQAELPDVTQSWVGRYTLVLPPADATVTNLPQGNGYATLTVNRSGVGALAGTLGDGTAVSGSAPVTRSGFWPWYAVQYNRNASPVFINQYQNGLTGPYLSRYGTPGAIVSWLTLTNAPFTSIVDWFILNGTGYRATNTTLTLEGAPYTTGPQLNTNWWVSFSGAGVVATNLPVTLNVLGNVIGANPLSLKVILSSGQFSGKFTSVGGKAIPFNGLLLQVVPGINGFGLFQTTTGQTGGVTLEPR